MMIFFVMLVALVFFIVWRWAKYYLRTFASVYFALALWFLWAAIFAVLFHPWR